MALPPGSRIGRYEILEHLGSGGMGVVYRARDDVLDRTVAVKLLPAEFLDNADRLRRFEQEARVTGRLNHPHIVAVFDAGVDGQQPFLVTELLDGETLRSRLKRGALSVGEALVLARQVTGALAAAHARGVVHRDLKPENILITREGSAKVLDFGLAKLAPLSPAESETRLSVTALGVAVGTAGYMAPEQVVGRAIDHRADIFSLGVVLHECLSGTQTFRRESIVDTLHAIVHDDSAELPPHVPQPIRQIVSRCLAKDPDTRFQSARDLEFALGALSSSSPDEASAGAPSSVIRRVRSSRGAALSIAVLVLIAAVAGAWLLRRGERSEDSPAASIRALAVLPLEDLSAERDQEYLADSLTEALITDLSQIRVLRVIGRTSVMRYKDSKRPLPEIARELGVSGVVEGSVLRVNDRIRVTARLIHAATEQHIWGEQYDREFRDILALQSELASTIADRIAVELTPGERARFAPAPVDPTSHEAYLRGRYFVNRRDPASLQLALEAFTSATRADPQAARAWAGLAHTYFYMGYAFGRVPPQEAMPKAREAATRALSIDPRLGAAHSIIGLVHLFYDWDRPAAEASLRRAISLDPGDPLAYHSLAAVLLTGRQPRAAVEEIRKAVRLDPVAVNLIYFLALCHLSAGELDAAEQSARRVLELEPNYMMSVDLLGNVAERRGDAAGAVEKYLEAARLRGTSDAELTRRLNAYRTGGLQAFHETELQYLVESWDGWHFAAFLIAAKQAGTGHRDEALSWLRRVRDVRSAGIVLANYAYEFDSYRSDPDFREILGEAFTPN